MIDNTSASESSAQAYEPELPDAVAPEGDASEKDDGPYSKAHYKEMKKLLKQRVKSSRYTHSVNVAKPHG